MDQQNPKKELSNLEKNSQKAKKILIFNSEKMLVLIGRSVRAASLAMKLNAQGISYAALGKLISTGRYYFRYIPDNVEVGIDDIGTLTLEDWDALCNIKRKTFKARKGRRVGTHKVKQI